LNDTVTIIASTAGKHITKAFRGSDYQSVQFNRGLEFLVPQIPVDNLKSLAAVIGGLETELTKGPCQNKAP